jgi:putative cell wall-binding protein
VLGDAVTNVAGTIADESSPSLYGRRMAYEVATTIMSSDVWLGTGTREIARTSGTNRYATAAAVSEAYFSESDTVILCTGENFPDALSAAPLARIMNVPLLLCRRDSMPAETAAEITRLQAVNVVVIGSDAAISQSMLEAFSDTITYSRIEGTSRYETSAAVARQVALKAVGVYKPSMAFFARGDNFPDALAVGPVAAGALAPVLLVPSTSVPAAISDVVDELNIWRGFVVGSTSAVGAGVQDTLEALMIANGGDPNPVTRWSGSDRYATAIAVDRSRHPRGGDGAQLPRRARRRRSDGGLR